MNPLVSKDEVFLNKLEKTGKESQEVQDSGTNLRN